MKRLKVQSFDPGVATRQTDVQFWAELSADVGFSPDDGPNPGRDRLAIRCGMLWVPEANMILCCS